MFKTAVILAGGLGKRLGHYTTAFPKSLLLVDGHPILEILLRQLAKRGFQRIILAVNHLSNLIQDFCGDGEKWGVSIEYSLEEEPLGTMGPIKQIFHLPDNFLILNSDILTDLDYGTFFDHHVTDENLFTIAYFEQRKELEYGILEIENHCLTGFREKPTFTYPVNMGVYMANSKILEFIPENTFFGLDHLLLRLLALKQPIATFLHKGKWIDIGSVENYQKASTRELV